MPYVGFLNIFEFFKTSECSSLKFLEKLSASAFCVPALCNTHIFWDVHHTYISFSISLQNSDLIPPLLFT